jgi:short-subunit dehydrogenase
MVIITGASSGIGADLARLYARREQPLLLVARRLNRLEELAAELLQTGTPIELLELDLARPGAVETLVERIGERPVDLLVNNAGLGWCSFFNDIDPAKIDEIVAVNILALTQLSRAVAGGMSRRGKGQILNVASIAGLVPGPFQAVYYASKAYVISLSKSLRYELAPSGVQVCCLNPGPTSSEFHHSAGVRGKSFTQRLFMTSSLQVAEAAVAGLERNQATIFPGWKHRLLGNVTRFLPDSLTCRIAARVGRKNKSG